MALDFLISYGMEYANFMFSTVKLLQPTLAILESLVTCIIQLNSISTLPSLSVFYSVYIIDVFVRIYFHIMVTASLSLTIATNKPQEDPALDT